MIFQLFLTFEITSFGVLLWLSGLRIQCCHCSTLSHCCDTGPVPGPGTSTWWGCGQKKKKTPKKPLPLLSCLIYLVYHSPINLTSIYLLSSTVLQHRVTGEQNQTQNNPCGVRRRERQTTHPQTHTHTLQWPKVQRKAGGVGRVHKGHLTR